MARKILDLSIDIDEDRLNHAVEVLNENNLSLEHAVKLFLYSVSNNNRLPFSTIDEKLSDSNSYLKDIADVLAGRYDYIYYVNVDDNSYLEFNMNNSFRALDDSYFFGFLRRVIQVGITHDHDELFTTPAVNGFFIRAGGFDQG